MTLTEELMTVAHGAGGTDGQGGDLPRELPDTPGGFGGTGDEQQESNQRSVINDRKSVGKLPRKGARGAKTASEDRAMKELLTASRMATLLACPRRHFWRYEFGLRRTMDADALRFGSAWHTGMEARWRGADVEGAFAAACGEKYVLDETQLATLSGMLAGYYGTYAEDPIKSAQTASEIWLWARIRTTPFLIAKPRLRNQVSERITTRCATASALKPETFLNL